MITSEFRKTMPLRGPGKLQTTVKQTVLSVFNNLQQDPKHNLSSFAHKYPREFHVMAARLIPTEITGNLRKVINVRINGVEQPKIENTEDSEVISEETIKLLTDSSAEDDDFLNID